MNGHRVPVRRITILAALLLGTLACGPSKDPVVALLDDIVEEASDRDVDALAEHLADDLAAGGMDKAGVVAMLQRYLAAYKALDVSWSDLDSVVKAGSARVSFKLSMTGVPRAIGGLGDLLPRSATYDITMVLREEGGKWLVTQAEWSQP